MPARTTIVPEFFDVEEQRAPQIPYRAIAEQMFPSPPERRQKLIPFLGAGASLGSPPLQAEPPVTFPDAVAVDRAIHDFNLTGRAALFFRLALRLAAKIQALEHLHASGAPSIDPVALAEQAKYPPSAAELAAALATVSAYDGFERPRRLAGKLLGADDTDLAPVLRSIAELTEIGPSVPPLLSVASYYEFTLQRGPLWNSLRRVFENKRTPTRTHCLVARAAAHHLSLNPRKDYLTITTNYDRLIEIALERYEVPHCVLTVANKDQYVDVRFSPNMPQHLGMDSTEFELLKAEHAGKYPRQFTLSLGRPVAIVYKLHGCLFPSVPERDSLIVSDEDYIRYLMQLYDGGGMIPGHLTQLMAEPVFLFLGYSFSDWNVRAIYKAVVKQRTDSLRLLIKDYAVVRDFSVYESAYSQEGNGRINLLVTELRRFVRRVLARAPKRRRPAVAAGGRP
jgi:hypothetical protein